MSSTFLKRDETKELTGRTKVALQIAQLAKMGIPFFVNVVGRPVVTKSAIEGRAGDDATEGGLDAESIDWIKRRGESRQPT